MRYVQRGPEPPDLTAFKAAANADWTPRYRALDKKPIRTAPAREQGFLCGYCGSRIGQREGDCHIEHVEAQSKNASRELDYTNMLGSCQGTNATPQVPEHCGQARGNVPLPVTPFMPDCERISRTAPTGASMPPRIRPRRRPRARPSGSFASAWIG